MKTTTMTFGILPSRQTFDAAWAAMCEEDGRDPETFVYKIRMGASGALENWHGDYTCSELYDRMKEEVEAFDRGETDFDDDNGVSVVGDILGAHFGIEWCLASSVAPVWGPCCACRPGRQTRANKP